MRAILLVVLQKIFCMTICDKQITSTLVSLVNTENIVQVLSVCLSVCYAFFYFVCLCHYFGYAYRIKNKERKSLAKFACLFFSQWCKFLKPIHKCVFRSYTTTYVLNASRQIYTHTASCWLYFFNSWHYNIFCMGYWREN